jgi:LysR family transcriptional regulator for bpeEF and oprC
MDQLSCMRVFSRVVELGSFARAADALDIARPSATTAVARLEKRLGVRLLHRTTRQLSLTEDGRVYYEACVRMLAELAETEDHLSRARRSPHGRLRVSIPTSLAHDAFMQNLPGFLARYPDLELELDVSNRAVNMVEEGIDCAVRAIDIPDDSTLVARHIADSHLVTCASPAYLKARGAPKSVAELAGHNCVRSVSASTGRVLDWKFEKDGEPASFTPKGNLAVNSFDAAAAAAARGIGIAQVPALLAIPLLRSRALRPLLLDWAARAPSVKVVYPSNRYLTAKVRAFADFVAETLAAGDWWDQIAATGKAPAGARRNA